MDGMEFEENLSAIVLIPAWNEAHRIEPVITGAQGFLPVLVVDDGSRDRTDAVAKAVGATVLRHPQNQGKGAALRTGFAWAMEHDYTAVITLDADGQHDPTEIPTFLAAHRSTLEPHLIIGRRDFRRMPFPRRYTNRIFGSWLLSWALHTPIYDSQSGYRLYSRHLLEAVEWASSSSRFDLEVEVIIQAVCRGMRLGWVDIRTIYGVGEVSYFHPVRDSARYMRMVWHAWRQRHRGYPSG